MKLLCDGVYTTVNEPFVFNAVNMLRTSACQKKSPAAEARVQ